MGTLSTHFGVPVTNLFILLSLGGQVSHRPTEISRAPGGPEDDSSTKHLAK